MESPRDATPILGELPIKTGVPVADLIEEEASRDMAAEPPPVATASPESLRLVRAL